MARSRMIDCAWLALWGLLSSWWCVSAAYELGATFDEPTYLRVGLECWRSGLCKPLMKLGTMPLPVDVQTLPLYVWEQWRGTPFNVETDLETILPVARHTTLIFWWLLLFYAMLAGRAIAGPWAGRLAVALLAIEPSFLAHASLATTDIAISACLLAFLYHFWIGRDGTWLWRLGLPGFWFAACVLAKASGMIFGGICVVTLELYRLHQAGRLLPAGVADLRGRLSNLWGQTRPLRRDLGWIAGLGFALTFLYVGCDWNVEPTFVKWASGLPEGSLKTVMLPVSEHLCIFSNAGEGLLQQVKHNVRGHGTYLLGAVYPRACWYFFWVLPTMKLSVPLLLLPVVVLAARPRSLWNWAFVAAFAALALAPFYRVQIGIRLVLPLITIGVIGLAAAAVVAYRELPALGQKLLAAGLAAGIAWTALETVEVFPNALCYVNKLWGGTDAGYVLTSDYDWGQGLKDLERWRRQQRLGNLGVWYFGSDPARRRFEDLPLHALPVQRPADVPRLARSKYVAVSVMMLHGSYSTTPSSQQALAYFRAHEPVARTSTFLIYRLPAAAGGAEEAAGRE